MRAIDKFIKMMKEEDERVREAVIEHTCPANFGIKPISRCFKYDTCKACWLSEIEEQPGNK